MSQPMRWTLLWLAGSTLMVVAALTMLTAAHFGNEYVPSNADAFYHARRILDALFSGNPVVQFDDRIHVPEGSWLTWPWGFDTLMTWITKAFGPYANEAAANRVLMNIPPAVAPIAVGIVLIIARQLALPLFLSALLVIGFAALPLVHMQFAVGNIDHHFAELLWTLGTLSAGIWFFRVGKVSVLSGITLGVVLGSAMAMHNGLFILQIPVALTLGVLWLRGLPLPDRRRTAAFALALLVTTLLICIPSEPWRRGFFEFYTLSWFHFYIAACVAVFSMALALLTKSLRTITLVVIAAAAAILPIVGTLAFAGEFVSGQLESIRVISEAKSPYALYFRLGSSMSTQFISSFLWLTGPMLLLNLWWIVRRPDASLQFVAIMGAAGLALMQLQFRFSVFGELSMLLTPVLAAHFLVERHPQWRTRIGAACLALFAVAFYPTIANWQLNWTLGGSVGYMNAHGIFPKLKALCLERPGIVLGDLDTGHWVTYHTRCPVIADVFLLTPQHAEKALESSRLMRLTARELLADNRGAGVRYVFAHHSTHFENTPDGEQPNLDNLRNFLQPLERQLLGPASGLPPQFKQQLEVLTPAGQVYARLYEIDRTP